MKAAYLVFLGVPATLEIFLFIISSASSKFKNYVLVLLLKCTCMFSVGYSTGILNYVSPLILITIDVHVLLYTMFCSCVFKMQICEAKRNYFCLGHAFLRAIFLDNFQ